MPLTRPTRTTAQIAQDRADAARLYAEGKGQAVIAAWLDAHRPYLVTSAMVMHDLAAIREDWLRRHDEALEVHRARELARLDRLEAECWDAWERSLRDQIKTSIEQGVDAANPEAPQPTGKAKRFRQVQQSWGEPRFLELLLRVVERRCKLLGLDKTPEIDEGTALRQLARQVAEEDGLDPDEVIAEAQRVASRAWSRKVPS